MLEESKFMKTQLIKSEDPCLLFDEFLYCDLKERLPLIVGPNVYLDHTPYDILDRKDLPELAPGVFPGYPFSKPAPLCLRSPATGVGQWRLPSDVLFFLTLHALRLCKPAEIKIEGSFELGRGSDIKSMTLFHLTSPWKPEDNANYYTAKDIKFSEKVAQRQLDLWGLKYKRINSAMVLFSQVTCGFSKSFQMSYLALFAALEALFVPKGKKAKTLACRAANFLSPFNFPELKDWLEKEYECGRNDLVHGVQDVVPWAKDLSPEKAVALGRLHEITRLSILGFMSLGDNQLESLSKRSGKELQKELDSIVPPSGRFLEGQQMWCA